MKLFGYLPETLFQPLAGPKKHVYARLLLRLYERVFAARVLETPTKDEVLKNIAGALPESGVINADELQEEGSKRTPIPTRTTSPITACVTRAGSSKSRKNGM